MWIFCNDGFVSAVEARDDTKCVWVRARRRAMLDNLNDELDKPGRIYRDNDADYRWRMKLPKKEFALLIAARIAEIDYDNFKNSIPEGDRDFKLLCEDVWRIGWEYQEDEAETTR